MSYYTPMYYDTTSYYTPGYYNSGYYNTGWYGGPYGTGQRMSLPYTRMMVRALVDGQLNNVEFIREEA